MVGANTVLVPERLSLKTTYTYVQTFTGVAARPGVIGTGGTLALPLSDSTGSFNRVDAIAKYQFNPDWVHSLGWKGEAYATLRYMWESSSVVDPSMVSTQYLYMMNCPATSSCTGSQGQRSVFLGWDNPNYNVHLVAASVGFKW